MLLAVREKLKGRAGWVDSAAKVVKRSCSSIVRKLVALRLQKHEDTGAKVGAASDNGDLQGTGQSEVGRMQHALPRTPCGTGPRPASDCWSDGCFLKVSSTSPTSATLAGRKPPHTVQTGLSPCVPWQQAHRRVVGARLDSPLLSQANAINASLRQTRLAGTTKTTRTKRNTPQIPTAKTPNLCLCRKDGLATTRSSPKAWP